jgi:putative DNA methylase
LAPKRKKRGFTLIFDVVRRFAQPLGIRLPDWEGRIIETEKGVVRLLSVKERAKQLFGDTGAQAVADELEKSSAKNMQLSNALSALYPKDSEEKRLLDAMLLAYPK